ncbi:MAG: HEPN domain-containing protein [Armatimonadota bacterium]|nr:HEPN domain-containing protein [Armatimonadota bacterium]
MRAARILRRSRAYDSAVYLCGYAVEIALKARICQTLKWSGFPETGPEFRTKQSLRTHDLDALLEFTGLQTRIQQPPLNADWSTVKLWNPEQRYRPVGTKTAGDADDMIAAARTLLDILL